MKDLFHQKVVTMRALYFREQDKNIRANHIRARQITVFSVTPDRMIGSSATKPISELAPGAPS